MKHSILCGSSLLLALSTPSFAGGLQQGQINNKGLNPDYPICSLDAKVYPLDMAWGFENGMSCRFASLDQANRAARFPDCSNAAQVSDLDPRWGWENNQSCWRGGNDILLPQGKVQGQQGQVQGQQGQIQGQQSQAKQGK